MMAFQPASLHSAARSAYLERFRSLAASIPSSHRTVSSTSRMVLWGSDHMIRSGQSDISTISLGNWSCFPRSTLIVHSMPGKMSLAVSLWRGGIDVLTSPCKQDGKSRWSERSAVSLPSAWFSHFCQLSQHKIVSPPVAALGQCRLAARQDMLGACIDGIAKGTGLLGTEPLVEVLGTR